MVTASQENPLEEDRLELITTA